MFVTRAIEQVTPDVAYRALAEQAGAELVDVRTRAEFAFVGLPDLRAVGKQVVTLPLKEFPSMQLEPGFADRVLAAAEEAETIYFLCRSGGRSMEAAQLVGEAAAAAGRALTCVNVAEGFEGDLDSDGHRGTAGGWKARGLPWRQT